MSAPCRRSADAPALPRSHAGASVTSGLAPIPRIVVFDIGGVLLDWDPRYLYRELFDGDDTAMERFLAEVCTPDWNLSLDAGRPFAEATEELAVRFPEQRAWIEAYDHRWGDMVRGAFEETVAILAELRERGVTVYALSNWSETKFQLMRARFPFLDWFDGVGHLRERPPREARPRDLRAPVRDVRLRARRRGVHRRQPANVARSLELGMRAVRFTSPSQARAALWELGLLD
jgi:2-haloacid dehalogenase